MPNDDEKRPKTNVPTLVCHLMSSTYMNLIHAYTARPWMAPNKITLRHTISLNLNEYVSLEWSWSDGWTNFSSSVSMVLVAISADLVSFSVEVVVVNVFTDGAILGRLARKGSSWRFNSMLA